jgi:hypothetical protein
MRITPKSARAAVALARATAFYDTSLPVGLRLVVKPLKKGIEGTYDVTKKEIEFNPDEIDSADLLLRVAAHELVHASLAQSGQFNVKRHHDTAFKKLAAIVCKRMGWGRNAIN